MDKTKADKLLRDLYFDPAAPGSFSGVAALKKAAAAKLKQSGNHRVKIKSEKVKKFLSDQDTYTLHKQARINYPRRRVVVGQALEQFQADLVDMSMFEKENTGFRWILTVIDVFSKRAFAIPVKRKDSKNMIEAFKTLERQTELPRKIQTDKGMEFRAKEVQQYFKSKGVHWFSSEDDMMKAQVVERFNRTLKGKMWKYFHYKKSNKWLHVLPMLMQSYNNTVHTSIKMTPNEGKQPKAKMQVKENLYGPKSRLEQAKGPVKMLPDATFMVGDKVKLSKHAMIFDKKYKPNWQLEIMIISEVIPTDPYIYRVKDLDGEEIKGTFYEHELQKVTSLPKVYDIEKVLEEKPGRIKVKWKGYPDKMNSWIPKRSLRKL